MPLFFNGTTTGFDEVPVGQIIAQASNVKTGQNPAFTAPDFLAFYPQFKNAAAPDALPAGFSEGLNVPDAVFDQFLTIANARVQEIRWHSQWKMGMCLLIAHYATLYLSATGDVTPAGIIASAEPPSLKTAESAGDVSASYDVHAISDDFEGFGDLKATTYGQQFASMARLLGKAGMMVW